MGFQSCGSPNFGKFWDSQLGSLGTKWHLGVGPVARHKDYYKREGGGFFQVRVVVNLVSLYLPMHQKCLNYALINLLFGLCRFVWIVDPFVICFSPHLGAPAHPSTLEVLRAKECTPTPYPFIVFILDLQLSLSRNLGVCHDRSQAYTKTNMRWLGLLKFSKHMFLRGSWFFLGEQSCS
jgi:hypothetical protein